MRPAASTPKASTAWCPAHHRRYAAVSLAFAVALGIAFALRATFVGLIVLAVYAVIVILYFSSFIRGASDYHE